ncbi:MAG: 1,6-anhydro-N-acetylmuramyl-L-alanine amidase AmpD [Congregibacter sp.]
MHNISLPPGCFGGGEIEAFFCNELDCSQDPFFAEIQEMRVSAHFLIQRDGALLQFVSCDDRAWHAGVSSWAGRQDCNDFSVGVELEGTDQLPYTPIQYQRLVELIRELRTHYPLLRRGGIVGHSDIAPGRKTDPGEAFQWPLLRDMLRDMLRGTLHSAAADKK